MLKKHNYLLVVVTNQPDVRNGKAKIQDVEKINSYIQSKLFIDMVQVCYSIDSDNDPRRKPGPDMLLESAKALKIDLGKSFIVGDRWRDINAGSSAGCKTVFIDYGYREKLRKIPNFKVNSLFDAATLILKLEGAKAR